jgi:hypothetical protein
MDPYEPNYEIENPYEDFEQRPEISVPNSSKNSEIRESLPA